MKTRTRSAAKKRLKITGTGKIMTQKASKNHLLSSKNKRQTAAHRLGKLLPEGLKHTMRRCLHLKIR